MKKLYFLVLALCLFNVLNAQTVTFRDTFFLGDLITSSQEKSIARDADGNFLKIDVNNNGQIEESELLPVASLKVNSTYIKDLTGISKFVNLIELDVNSCYLSTLDLSQLKNIKTVKCKNNVLTVLNLTGLTKIENLDCSNNLLSSLDLTGLTGLKNLSIAYNKFTLLNVQPFKNLENLKIESNSIKTIDISNLAKLLTATFDSNPLTTVNASNCTSLKQIILGNLKLTNANVSGCTSLEELNVAYSVIADLNAENCDKLVRLVGLEMGGSATRLTLKNCTSLSEFRMTKFSTVDLDLSNCSALTYLECSTRSLEKLNLSGCFNLKTLIASNNLLAQINLSGCNNLEKVVVEFNKLSSLSFSGKKIRELRCAANLLTDLNLSGFTELETLMCNGNKLTNINTTGLTSLKTFNCSNNFLTGISLSQFPNLENLDCTYNKLVSLDVSNSIKLKTFSFVIGNPLLKSLNASGCVLLENLTIDNPLAEINLSGCSGLKTFYLVKILYENFGKLTILNFENCSNLEKLEVKSREMGNINIANCSKLNSFTISYGSLDKILFGNNTSLSSLFFDNVIFSNELDLRSLPALRYLSLNSCEVPHVDVSNSSNLTTFSGSNVRPLESVNASGCQKLTAYDINTKKLNLSGCTSLKSLLYTNNSDVEILDVTGCSAITDIQVGNSVLYSFKFLNCPMLNKIQLINTSLTNLNFSDYPNLTEIVVGRSKSLADITFLNLPLLKKLEVFNNSVSSLDLKNLKSLETLYCNENLLINLDLQGLTNLKNLSCAKNKLQALDIAGLKKIEKLDFSNNQITKIDVNNNVNLRTLDCSDNLLDELNVSGSPNIVYLMCLRNKITTLDLKELKKLSSFNCIQNEPLNSIFLNNLNKDVYIDFYINANQNLKYICVDESRVQTFQKEVNRLGYLNCHVNSYCSFTPNGSYAMVQGNTRLDENNNGCEVSDLNVPNVKFQIKDALTEGTVISDHSGFYTFPIQNGNYSVIPKLECEDCFSISPASLDVKIESQTPPVTQDFCLIPNGIYKDLEIVLIPLEEARPGFEVKYKIVYKNKGNAAQSGNVSIIFDGSTLKMIESNPLVLEQGTNKLMWNFVSLKPFETREITFKLRLNAPTSTPAVNNGDILKFTTNIIVQDTDKTPIDNTFTLNQTVVGSYDPNDKTCLEGSVITPNLIGEYVHYMIRFENTGTYQAENVVIKDMIDLAKFDISTLVPTSSSHPFVTKISEGNKVEFIFEGINLPFDDANNDGYVAFKIKTKPTLKVGDTFENDANIYFDYNFPILTNKATSTFKNITLGKEEFDFSTYFTVSPNPTSDVLNINTKQDIEIQSLSVYDILGQLVIAVPNAKAVSTVDVSRLTTGSYFIKVKSNKGSSGVKFIKK